jgi:phosphatidylserine decarboxylase
VTARSLLARLAQHEELNFLLTNRLPRRSLSRFMGWFSRIEQPIVSSASIAVWRQFTDLDLSDARTTCFASMHDCFTRRLKEGARPIDPDRRLLVSPCDAIVGASGRLDGLESIQAKGHAYALDELLQDPDLAHLYRNGWYVTLRLTSGMYHRFHAPDDCCVEKVVYIYGDAWNVNPPALSRVERVFCRNERAVIRARLDAGYVVTLVPVAAILVAGIRLSFLDLPARTNGRTCQISSCNAVLRRGQEMGWFEHGSTMLVFVPEGFALCDGARAGELIRVGQPLLRLP